MIKKIIAPTLLAAAVLGTFVVSSATGARTWSVSTPTALTQAEQQAQPGDTIDLSGTFKNVSLIPKVSGTSTAPITYKSTTGATFDGAGPSGVAAITGRSYLVFDGITFTNSNYINAPVANKGVILRSSNYITFSHDSFTHMQMQLIGASHNTIINNTWRYFVASYIKDSSGVLQPQTSGDMLGIVSSSHDNDISFNDMKYGGHSLIEVGSGWSTPNINNHIHDNILSNPWYKNLILADDGTGSIVENNKIIDTCSQPGLYSTQPGATGVLVKAADAIQFSGSNYIVRNNLFDNITASTNTGIITLGARWYYGQGAPAGGTKIESKNNQIYGNTIQNSLTGVVFSFVQNYTPGTDLSLPVITGNVFHDNTFINVKPNPAANPPSFWTIYYRSFKGAPTWTGLGGNKVYSNVGFSSVNAYLSSYVNASNVTTTKKYTLAQFNWPGVGSGSLLDQNVYGNS